MLETPISPEDIQVICASIEKSLSGPILTLRNATISVLRAEIGPLKERAKFAEGALKQAQGDLQDSQADVFRLSQIEPLKGCGIGPLLDEVERLGWQRPVLVAPVPEKPLLRPVIPELAKLSFDPSAPEA